MQNNIKHPTKTKHFRMKLKKLQGHCYLLIVFYLDNASTLNLKKIQEGHDGPISLIWVS